MAREVLIRYATRNVKEALQIMRDTHKAARDAARQIKNAAERRRELERLKGEQFAERQGLLKEQKAQRARQALERRAAALRGGQRGIDAGRLGGRVNELREVIGAGAALNVESLATKAGPVGILAAAVYAAVIRPLQAEADRRFERMRAELEAKLAVDLQRQLRELNIAQRLKDDPAFALQRARLAESEARGLGLHKAQHQRSARLAGLL